MFYRKASFLFGVVLVLFLIKSEAFGFGAEESNPWSTEVHFLSFNGFEGYREIKLSDSSYFVAFHGVSNAEKRKVEGAWALRSAQLCEQSGARYFIELAYGFEPVTRQELKKFVQAVSIGRPRRAGDMIFIPMPMYTTQYPIRRTAASKLGTIRCVGVGEEVMDKSRLVDIDKVFEEGEKLAVGFKRKNK